MANRRRPVAEEVLADELPAEEAAAEAQAPPEEAPAEEPVVVVAPPVVLADQRVVLFNPSATLPCYIPLAAGDRRLGPKESVELPLADVTDAARALGGNGRIHIRNL
jgi:hypothetical protein